MTDHLVLNDYVWPVDEDKSVHVVIAAQRELSGPEMAGVMQSGRYEDKGQIKLGGNVGASLLVFATDY